MTVLVFALCPRHSGHRFNRQDYGMLTITTIPILTDLGVMIHFEDLFLFGAPALYEYLGGEKFLLRDQCEASVKAFEEVQQRNGCFVQELPH
jgi:hypothetical protein